MGQKGVRMNFTDDDVNSLLIQELDSSGALHIVVSARELAQRHHLSDSQYRKVVNFLVSRYRDPGAYVRDIILISRREGRARYRIGRKPVYELNRRY